MKVFIVVILVSLIAGCVSVPAQNPKAEAEYRRTNQGDFAKP